MSVRVPAEWEFHDGCITAWPHLKTEWQAMLTASRLAILSFANALSDSELVTILVNDKSDVDQVKTIAPKTAQVVYMPVGDIWLRDTGPIWVFNNGRLETRRFSFNGWGNKYLFENDDDLAQRISQSMETPQVHCPLVLEGGALDFNGDGTALTTKQCALNPNRNIPIDEHRVAAALEKDFGVNKILWIERGLLGDHTDGHVDNICRFVKRDTVAIMTPSANDPQAQVLSEVANSTKTMRIADGTRLQTVEIPSPGPCLDGDGNPIPASYLNFYIANHSVVVPTFSVQQDETALRILQEVFPDRSVVGLDARAVLSGGGTFHCATQPIPRFQ